MMLAGFAGRKNVLIIFRFSSEWQGIVFGAVFIAAVAIDSIVNRRRVA
jgi:ribose/xylose/arabinose/galactoside ABC-type transport system permease subunit